MPLVISTDLEDVKVQVHGNWFVFKPGQIKNMQPSIVSFLSIDKRELGFMGLPESCEDDLSSEASKEAIAVATLEGRRNILTKLNRMRYNIEVSLKRDLDIAGIKADPISMVDDRKAAVELYRKLAKYKDLDQDSLGAELDEISKLKEQIDGTAQRTDASPTPQRNQSISKPAKS